MWQLDVDAGAAEVIERDEGVGGVEADRAVADQPDLAVEALQAAVPRGSAPLVSRLTRPVGVKADSFAAMRSAARGDAPAVPGLAKARHRLGLTWEVLTAPEVRVQLSGGDTAREVFLSYTAAHPRFKVAQRKRWGVALLPLPDSLEEYLRGGSRELVRRKRRRAAGKGFTFREFRGLDHIADVLEINRSAPARQGQPMLDSYTNEHAVRRFCERCPRLDGVFDDDGRLRAYSFAPILGEAGNLNRLLGHAEDLDDGIMYLLVSEVIGRFIAAGRATGKPRWAMYDTFWGARQGMVHFKKRLGFEPYRVRWAWREQD